ncbi:hypothetical protein PENANT_c005G06107 [Penicillium antarcticum]|uniref:Uncharacterized protein n=1 Tax=Penicillium antarcticum TaxID=416450 RepID=A0A1V6QF01_9EURO|nr:hypothetical protein PENANT_c005G06107 [Penicillium antarcticum]
MSLPLRPKELKVVKLENILKGIGYPYHSASSRNELGNGVMELRIANWKSDQYTFDLRTTNKVCPKGGFQLELTDQDMVVTFVIKNDYPFGMDGLCDNLADIFLAPEDLGMSEFIVGKDAVSKTMKSKKKGADKWSNSFTVFGCHVNTMTDDKSPALLKYKFLPMKPLHKDEQVIVTINKDNVNFRGVAQSNLTEYGEAMAVPIRIWLCTKWMAEKAGGASNDLFGKMSTTNTPSTAHSISPQKPENFSSEAPEGQGEHSKVVDRQAALAESVSNLDAGVEKSTEGLMAELTFGDGGDTALQDKADTPGPALRGDSFHRVQIQKSNPIALTGRRLTTVRKLTVPVPVIPLIPTVLRATNILSSETARSHFSPPTSSPSSPLFPVITSPSGRDEAEKGDVREESEQLASPSDQPILTSPTMEVECELRFPVSGRDGLCFSDPEDYTNYRLVAIAVEFPREESADAVRLGLFEGLQRNTRSSLGADSALSFDLIERGFSADKEEFAKIDVQDSVCSACGTRLMKNKNPKEDNQYISYRLGHMSGTGSPSDNGGEGHHSPLATITEESGSPKAMQQGDDLISEVGRVPTLAEISYSCAFMGCGKLCSLMDEMSVVCPKCGPFSTVRYCGKRHMWDDAVMHWEHCGESTLTYQCQAGPVPLQILVGPPMLHNVHGLDSPEHHRQALWFSSASNQGDYFVFADFDPFLPRMFGAPASHGPPCSIHIDIVVRFDDPLWKDRFRRLLAMCLFGKFIRSFTS